MRRKMDDKDKIRSLKKEIQRLKIVAINQKNWADHHGECAKQQLIRAEKAESQIIFLSTIIKELESDNIERKRLNGILDGQLQEKCREQVEDAKVLTALRLEKRDLESRLGNAEICLNHDRHQLEKKDALIAKLKLLRNTLYQFINDNLI